MIQRGTFSSPHNGMLFCCGSVVFRTVNVKILVLIDSLVLTGQAFVIFKSKATADMVISRLNAKCLMLTDGRYLVAFLLFS